VLLCDEFTAIDALWIALSVFCVVVALALAYLLLRLAGTARRLTLFLQGLEAAVVPLVNKAGGTVDRINAQLDKVDHVTDSAVDAAGALDTAIRAVSLAVTRPVQKLSGLAAGVRHGAAALWVERDLGAALQAGREAAARRERDIAEELAHTDRAR